MILRQGTNAVCRLLRDTATTIGSRSTWGRAALEPQVGRGGMSSLSLQPNYIQICSALTAEHQVPVISSNPPVSLRRSRAAAAGARGISVQPSHGEWSLLRGYSTNGPKETSAAPSLVANSKSSRRSVVAEVGSCKFPAEMTGFSDVQLTPEEVDEFESAAPGGKDRDRILRGAYNRWIAEAEKKTQQGATFKAGDILAHGRYQLMKKHDRGMGVGLEQALVLQELLSWNTLWDGCDLATNQNVAIKICEAGDPTHHIAATRAAALHALAGDHPNILRVLDAFEQRTVKGRHACVVMEPAGSSLDYVQQNLNCYKHSSRFSIKRVSVSMASTPQGIRALKSHSRQLFTALDVIHRHGVIHMNVSPEHILLDKPFVLGTGDLQDNAPGLLETLDVGLSALNPTGSRLKTAYLLAGWVTGVGSATSKIQAVAADRYKKSYHQGNLHTATIKLTGFSQAMPYKPLAAAADGPLSHNTSCNRDGGVNLTPVSFRSPEEILDIGYASPAYDIWRAGVTIFYLATSNHLLFNPITWYKRKRATARLEEFGDDEMHLWDIIDTVGSLPIELIRRSPRFEEFFLPNNRLRLSSILKTVPAKNDLSKLLLELTDGAMPVHEINAFHNFITFLLRPDPVSRPTAADVLKHPWLQDT